MPQSMPHNGNLLQELMKEKRFSKPELATALNTNQMAIKRFIEKNSLYTKDLWNLSLVMGVNMFSLLAGKLPLETPTDKEIALQKQVEDLQKEVAIYKGLLQKNL